jgi:nucleoside-diphosphate-sugar epimerase
VYKQANEGTARVYSLQNGFGSVGLRPFIVYGPARDQGMSSEPTKAMLAAAAGQPYRMKFNGNLLLTHAEDCARVFIGAARAAAGSGDALCLNVPGRRAGMADVARLIEEIVPRAQGLITWESAPVIRAPALISAPAVEDVIGAVHNRPLAEGVRQTIEHFERALGSGLLAPPAA